MSAAGNADVVRVTAQLASGFIFTALDLLFVGAVAVLLLVGAIVARFVIRATRWEVAGVLDIELLEPHAVDEPAEHVAAG